MGQAYPWVSRLLSCVEDRSTSLQDVMVPPLERTLTPGSPQLRVHVCMSTDWTLKVLVTLAATIVEVQGCPHNFAPPERLHHATQSILG